MTSTAATTPLADAQGFQLLRWKSPAGQVRAWHSPGRWVQLDAETGDEATLLGILGEVTGARKPEPCLGDVVLVGSGSRAHAIAMQLSEHPGIRRVFLVAGPRQRLRTWQSQLAGRRTPGGPLVAVTHGVAWEAGDAGALVIVSPDTIEADRDLLWQLTRHGREHLVVTAHAGYGSVGPWVVPGVTACLACRDHWMADSDAGHPWAAALLAERAATTDQLVVRWVAATVAAELARPDGCRRRLRGAQLVTDRLDPWAAAPAWQQHPRCRCHAVSRQR